MVPLSRKITMDRFRGSDGRGRDLRSSLHYYLCYFLLQGIRRCISAAFRRITRIFFDGITDGDSSDDIEVKQGRRFNQIWTEIRGQCGGVHGLLLLLLQRIYGHKEMCQLFKRSPIYQVSHMYKQLSKKMVLNRQSYLTKTTLYRTLYGFCMV